MRRTISADTWEQVRTAHASGIGLREIARSLGLPEGTVLAKAKRAGWTQQIKSARSLVRPVEAIALAPADAAAVTMQQRGERYVGRLAGVVENVVPHLEAMEPAEVLSGIHAIEKFDRVARRTYGLADGQQVGGALNVSILTNQAAIGIVDASRPGNRSPRADANDGGRSAGR